MKKVWFFFLFCFAAFFAQAQQRTSGLLEVTGKVTLTKSYADRVLKNPHVVVYPIGKPEQAIYEEKKNDHSFNLNLNSGEYIIKASCKGYYSKSFQINTAVISKEAYAVYSFPFTIDLIPVKEPKSEQDPVFEKPVTILKYSPSEDLFMNDSVYTKALQIRVDSVLNKVSK